MIYQADVKCVYENNLRLQYAIHTTEEMFYFSIENMKKQWVLCLNWLVSDDTEPYL